MKAPEIVIDARGVPRAIVSFPGKGVPFADPEGGTWRFTGRTKTVSCCYLYRIENMKTGKRCWTTLRVYQQNVAVTMKAEPLWESDCETFR